MDASDETVVDYPIPHCVSEFVLPVIVMSLPFSKIDATMRMDCWNWTLAVNGVFGKSKGCRDNLSCPSQDLMPNLEDNVVNLSVLAGLCTECVSLESKCQHLHCCLSHAQEKDRNVLLH